MLSLDTIARGIDVRKVGLHSLRDLEGTTRTQGRAARLTEANRRAHPGDHEDQIGLGAQAIASLDHEAPCRRLDQFDSRRGVDFDSVPLKLCPDLQPERRVDSVKDARARFA